MNILELYSGIGGMHLGFEESGIRGEIVAAVDINTVANTVYAHNFPHTLLLNRNIQSLTEMELNKLNVNTILMSPPCQPFTRNGLKADHLDPRTDSFMFLLQEQLPKWNHIDYILMENVHGFETSIVHDLFVRTLGECGFSYREFLLCPSQITQIPNSRLRYYCLAKRKPLTFNDDTSKHFSETSTVVSIRLSTIMESDGPNLSSHLLPNEILLKRSKLLDIRTSESSRSCCFTKAYGKYVEGTGSVFTPKLQRDIDRVYKEVEGIDPITNPEQYLDCIKQLKLRYFTAREIMRLMAFPESYTFPICSTTKQKYRLLGNSVNVQLVSKLLQLLISE